VAGSGTGVVHLAVLPHLRRFHVRRILPQLTVHQPMVDLLQQAVLVITISSTERYGLVTSKERRSWPEHNGPASVWDCWQLYPQQGRSRLLNRSRWPATGQVVSKERVAGYPTGWKDSRPQGK
jgi:hypothetical protein